MLNLSEMKIMSFSLVHICIHIKESYTGVDPKQDDAWPLPTWGAIGIPGNLEAGDTTWGLRNTWSGEQPHTDCMCARDTLHIICMCECKNIQEVPMGPNYQRTVSVLISSN